MQQKFGSTKKCSEVSVHYLNVTVTMFFILIVGDIVILNGTEGTVTKVLEEENK